MRPAICVFSTYYNDHTSFQTVPTSRPNITKYGNRNDNTLKVHFRILHSIYYQSNTVKLRTTVLAFLYFVDSRPCKRAIFVSSLHRLSIVLLYQVHFYYAINQIITKKMHFFFCQSVVFCPFLRYIYGGVYQKLENQGIQSSRRDKRKMFCGKMEGMLHKCVFFCTFAPKFKTGIYAFYILCTIVEKANAKTGLYH